MQVGPTSPQRIASVALGAFALNRRDVPTCLVYLEHRLDILLVLRWSYPEDTLVTGIGELCDDITHLRSLLQTLDPLKRQLVAYIEAMWSHYGYCLSSVLQEEQVIEVASALVGFSTQSLGPPVPAAPEETAVQTAILFLSCILAYEKFLGALSITDQGQHEIRQVLRHLDRRNTAGDPPIPSRPGSLATINCDLTPYMWVPTD